MCPDMHKDKLRLWTVQSPCFSLTERCVDHSKSKYYRNTPGVKDAYPELWCRLQIPDGQVVWCCTDERDVVRTTEKMIEWELYVPGQEIICFIDDLVWNRILGSKCAVRREMYDQWHKEASEKFPNDLEASEAYKTKCYEDFWRQEPKSGNWWDELFTESAGNRVSALIRHPIPCKEWIHKRTCWHSGDSPPRRTQVRR